MSTAIIGVGHIGRTLAEHLADGGERVILAATEPPDAVAKELGDLASASTVAEAIEIADVVIFAVMFDVTKELVSQHRDRLSNKVVVDPSNPVAADDKGDFHRTLPDGVSAGAVIAGMIPSSAHFVKAFGTVSADSLRDAANRQPSRAVLFFTTDDGRAEEVIRRLITAAGFDPVKAGGLDASLRIEMYGDLHQFGGLDGRVLDVNEARVAVGTEADS